MKSTTFFVACSLLLFAACSSSNYINVSANFTETNKMPAKEKQKQVIVFLEGEKADFKYTSIGMVEAVGIKNAPNSDILAELKYEAWQHGANAIINVKTSNGTTEEKTVGEAMKGEPGRIFPTKTFTGVAVHIDAADMPTAFANRVDTSFVKHHKDYIIQAEKYAQTGTAFTLATGLITTVVVAIVSSKN
jgi:hypothetical protein